MKKLHVPSPGEKHEDPLALYDVLSVSIALCLFLAIGAAVLIMTSSPKTKQTDATSPTIIQDGTDFVAVKQTLETFEKLGPEQLRQFAWTPASAAAAWKFGSREASEAACEHFAPRLNSDKLAADTTTKLQNNLAQSLNRKSITAPWTCLFRLLLNEQIPKTSELHTELENTWQIIENFEGFGPLAASVVDGFRLTRNRPESPRFDRWLKLCAFQFSEDARTSFAAAMSCHSLLNQIKPEHGEDFIMAADRLWSESPTAWERHSILRALSILADKGQPYAWRIDETPTMPDYNADFQLGIIFTLCRVVHSPDESDAVQAAAAIAAIAGSSIRPADVNLLYRWRKTCRLAFLDKNASPDDEMPLLQVSSPPPKEENPAENPEEKTPPTPDYSLASLMERGHCTRVENKPDWYCGSERWRGGRKKPADALSDWYNETRYVEWID